MFQKTRLKLTAWYLLIIMAISLAFSGVIYVSASREFNRILVQQKYRLEHPQLRVLILQNGDQITALRSLPTPDPQVINAARLRVLEELTIVNICIFILSAIAGYFLAGRTLKPISTMLDEQNRFIADASHELNTPLTSLRTMIEVNLRNKVLTLGKAKHVLESSLEEIGELESLSTELIGLTRYQQSHGKQVFSEVPIPEIISEAREKVREEAREKRISITQSVPDMKIRGDRKSLTELFVVLLDNAVKYSPPRKRIVVSGKQEAGKITVSITDQGIGIAKEDLPHIFDRFYRADKSRTKQETPGYGLGLSIAKRIAELHKGEIRAESTVGEGTTFTVILPLVS